MSCSSSEAAQQVEHYLPQLVYVVHLSGQLRCRPNSYNIMLASNSHDSGYRRILTRSLWTSSVSVSMEGISEVLVSDLSG